MDFYKNISPILYAYKKLNAKTLCFLMRIAIKQGMNATIEERVTALEKQVEQLTQTVTQQSGVKQDWRSMVGWAKDDPLYEEAMRFAAEYRRTGRIEGDDADS